MLILEEYAPYMYLLIFQDWQKVFEWIGKPYSGYQASCKVQADSESGMAKHNPMSAYHLVTYLGPIS